MSSENCSLFVQPQTTSLSPTPCTFTACRCNDRVCRLRLDFLVRLGSE